MLVAHVLTAAVEEDEHRLVLIPRRLGPDVEGQAIVTPIEIIRSSE